jgi:hypothetical protein
MQTSRLIGCALLALAVAGCASHPGAASSIPEPPAAVEASDLADWTPPTKRPKWVAYDWWEEHPVLGNVAYVSTVLLCRYMASFFIMV